MAATAFMTTEANQGGSFPQETEKYLLGKELLHSIEFQSKAAENSTTQISKGEDTNDLYTFKTLRNGPSYCENLLGHVIYRSILCKYFRANRINQQLANAIPNNTTMPNGWIEYDCIYGNSEEGDADSYQLLEERTSMYANKDMNVDVEHYASKIAASFLSMDCSTNISRTSSLDYCGPLVAGKEREGYNFGSDTKDGQGYPNQKQDDHPESFRGPRKPVIVRLRNNNPFTPIAQATSLESLCSPFPLLSLRPMSDAITNGIGAGVKLGNSVKHVPSKAVQAMNLEEAMKNRLLRAQSQRKDSCKRLVRMNWGGGSLQTLAPILSQNRSHRGSKGPRPNQLPFILRELHFDEVSSKSSVSQENSNNGSLKLNKNDFNSRARNSSRRPRSCKSGRSRRRKQQQVLQQ
eukprot:TRINITY_DN7870_c0_g1_i2.p1 TRINITY_DN7870_c0_g1~~TRINITY_DN7870_c0_g1_i2.p1  ORF type:complete len:406 (-),score=17.93 TRINITY_DN7870_c0_g1_i2:842-2059(-)